MQLFPTKFNKHFTKLITKYLLLYVCMCVCNIYCGYFPLLDSTLFNYFFFFCKHLFILFNELRSLCISLYEIVELFLPLQDYIPSRLASFFCFRSESLSQVASNYIYVHINIFVFNLNLYIIYI